MENYRLNNGVLLPKIGLGVYQIKEKDEDSIIYALQKGYRHLDTAAFYHNEEMTAVNFYEKLGYERSGSIYKEDGVDCINLVKKIEYS